MRRKIAKKRRKAILRKGGEIVREEWLRAHTGRRKDDGFCVEVNYNGCNCFSADNDELSAYNGIWECIRAVDEDVMAEGKENG